MSYYNIVITNIQKEIKLSNNNTRNINKYNKLLNKFNKASNNEKYETIKKIDLYNQVINQLL